MQLDVEGKTFATGVSDARGTVPRFGEALVEVPVTVSAFRMARQVVGAMGSMGGGKPMDGSPMGKIWHDLSGKLSGSGFSSVRFGSKGEFALPGAASGPTALAR